MAGHSKWANIKRRKAAQDGKKMKIFAKVTREIIVAAQQGGGNPSENPRLRVALQNAKSVNLPKENMQRAIKKGSGQEAGTHYQKVTYEGYAPYGVAVFVETMTDNIHRTVAEVRAVFKKNKGNLDKKGAIQHLFSYKGVFILPHPNTPAWQEQMLELIGIGVEDIEETADETRLICPPDSFTKIQQALEKAQITYDEAGIHYIPHALVSLSPAQTDAVNTLVEGLEALDDVQQVFHNLATL